MTVQQVRCAIYTRKSSDEKQVGNFTTLENQREYCAAYVLSQSGGGWTELSARYDDGGYSGGNLRRPALERLRADIAAGSVDIVLVYKIDRLSRSLRDFANLVAEFEARGVSFVSVTQAFDTSSSMGRLTLNMLLSFAQFEREITGERLKDWFAGARARGLWTSPRPLGYRVVDLRLAIHPEEAEMVRTMYRLYIKHGSGRMVANLLTAAGHLSHRGGRISAYFVTRHIRSRLYRGDLSHSGQPIPGQHGPIVSERVWSRAQAAMATASRRRAAAYHMGVPAPLKGLLFGATGHALVRQFATTRGGMYRYYVPAIISRHGPSADPIGRLRADDLEGEVARLLAQVAGDLSHPPPLCHLSSGRTPPARDLHLDADFAGLVSRNVARIDVLVSGLAITLKSGRVLASGWIGGRVEPRGEAFRRARAVRLAATSSDPEARQSL